MIERNDGLTRKHPFPNETLLGYIERVLVGQVTTRRYMHFELEPNVRTFEPSYVFSPYVSAVPNTSKLL